MSLPAGIPLRVAAATGRQASADMVVTAPGAPTPVQGYTSGLVP